MNRDWLNENAINTEAKIKIANNSDLDIVSKGTATINVVVENEQKLIPANEVMYAPDAAVNLLSITKIVRNGHKVIFDNTGAKIINSMIKTVATGSETNGIYQLDTEPIKNEVYSCVGQTSSNLWHPYDVLESENDPQTYKEAYKSKEWQQAIQSELMSHDKLKTWSITDGLPDGKSPIDTRWVFRTKEDGTEKARLVAKGFQL
ncbi:hypothetical protein JTB14_035639 [Gonioctena quinquepunctata]|nr:hypothetical protein JTB14_035639 [Gonioctena quinquepunctata]